MKGRTYSRQTTIWHGALILTLAGLVTKVLSVVYRIPFQNIAGDVGFYIYQQVYPIYGIALILSLYGFPVVISKMTAGQSDVTRTAILRYALFYLLGFGLVLFISLFIGAGVLASWMGDEKLVLPLRTVSVAFLIMPFLSVYRGYFQGVGNMVPTAASQVFDQSIRVLLILSLTYLFISNGSNLYMASSAAVAGSVAGGFFALLTLVYFRIKQGLPIADTFSRVRDPSPAVGWKEVGTALFFHGIAICISSLVLIIFQLVDSMTVLKVLVKSGMDLEFAKGWKGVFDRGQPLLQLGTVFATSLSLTIVPFISNAFKKGQQEEIKEKTRLAVKVSGVIGLGASLGLILIMEPTNRMLFEDAAGTNVLRVFSLTILFSSLTMTLYAVMQGMDMVVYPLIIISIGVLIKWFFNLLIIPVYGTTGAALATVAGFLVMTILSLVVVKKRMRTGSLFSRKLFVLIYAATAMVVVLWAYNLFFSFVFGPYSSRMIASIHALSAVVIGAAVYLILIIKRELFSEEELAILPVGNQLGMAVKKRIRGEKKNGA